MSIDNVKAIVLAAGQGVRMKSGKAKVLHELLGRPLVRHVLQAVRAGGVKDVLVVVGHQEEAVRKVVGEDAVFVRQDEQKGTGHAVLCARKALDGFEGDLLVLAGDAPLVSPATISAMIVERRRSRSACTVLTSCIDDPRGYGRVVRDAAGNFLKIVEEAEASDKEKGIQEVNSGIYVFHAPALWKALAKVKPSPVKGELYLTDALAAILAQGGTVTAQKAAEQSEVYGINTRRDLVAASNFLRWRVLERHLDGGVTIVDPSTTFIEDDVEIGPDTVVRPYSVIEHGVRIGSGCDVGPFARLRTGTVLEDGAEVGNFVEVKKSRLGRGSKAKHLAYLGDATLGEKVNIGAGTITANYDGRSKHPTEIGDGARTGSNTVLVAPVKLGKGAVTGAGAVVLAGQDVPAGGVAVGVPARVLGSKPAPAGKRAKAGGKA